MQNDSTLNIDTISEIFEAGNYRADNEYLKKIIDMLKTQQFNKVSSLSQEVLWGEDEMGAIPCGDRVYMYLIVLTNGIVKLRIDLYKREDAVDESSQGKFTGLYNDNISGQAFNYFTTKTRIYPYE